MKRTEQIGLLLGIALLGFQAGLTQGFAGEGTTDEERLEANTVAQVLAESTETNATERVVNPIPPEAYRGVRREAVIAIGKDVELRAEDSTEAVVVIGGSAKVHGRVREAVVAIGGNVETTGEVREAIVAIGGTVNARGKAGQVIVAILGDVNLENTAEVRGDVIAIGGKVNIADGAVVRGHVQDIDIGSWLLPRGEGLKDWFVHCVLKMRPLALQSALSCSVWGVILLVYLLAAVAMPRPVRACVNQLTTRPATTFLTGLLMTVALPVILLILALTGVGLLVVPFLVAGLVLGAIVGKAAMLEYIGERITRQFGLQTLHPLIAFLVGAALVTLIYFVPVLSLVTMSIIGFWSLGAVTTAALAALRRERPPRETRPSPPTGFPIAPGPQAATFPMSSFAETAADPASPATGRGPETNLPAMMLPKAGFWLRLGAGLLDAALILFAVALVANSPLGHAFGPAAGFVVALTYFAGMWTWKGTTFGGTVLRLQVVDYEGRPITFVVALVRGLAAAFSIAALFLGFFWIGWDREQQGWHDKIAGTFVVRVPRSMPLVAVKSAK